MVSDPNPHYTVLARRFRPKSFDEVVGQGHVGQAIQNAIRSGRVAHAYLFTGARGVGKTSTARIFAKALNCPNTKDGIPCNECEICQGIGAGNDVDVLEIDGASNRGIDDIRQLRANVSIRSMRSPNKVYIIDEVHMLTKEAFNALLKTLEEPPPNVKFVFCTTEPNKVPDTILSRCQRFDFGTIAQSSISTRLKQIAEAEGKVVDDDAVELIARRAAGSMRDSQSLFDQLLAFGGEQITAADVHQLLGSASDDRLIELVEDLINGQPGNALARLEAALQQGVQIGSLSDQLLAYLRDLLVTAAEAKDVPLSAVTESSREDVNKQAQKWGLISISAAMQILAETKSRMQRANYARALLELALVRMATLEQLDQIAALVQRAATGGAGSSASPSRPVGNSSSALKKNDRPASVVPRPALAATATESPQETRAQPAPVPENTPQHSQQLQFTPQNLAEFWERLLQGLPEKLVDHLKNAKRTASFGPSRLEFSFPKCYLFSKSYCDSADSRKKLALAIQDITGQAIEFRISVDETTEPVVKKSARAEIEKQLERRKNSTVESDTFVQSAVGVFGGQVVEVRPLRSITTSPEEESELSESEE